MFKHGANAAMDLKTQDNSNSNINGDIIIRLDRDSDPNPSKISGKITYNINGLDTHIMTAAGLGINNILSTEILALNISGDTLLSTSLYVSRITKFLYYFRP